MRAKKTCTLLARLLNNPANTLAKNFQLQVINKVSEKVIATHKRLNQIG